VGVDLTLCKKAEGNKGEPIPFYQDRDLMRKVPTLPKPTAISL
jgi:hypothetical protein